ncbi:MULTISPECIES: pyrophosphatase PpaX [Paenibacillus]|uniref:Pyrophosphatase PpaX n=1 Tax=Paenibacillus campinasensis TaxID=66347 RepID=A0A268EFR0_9BACL|nr:MULTISPECIES: pyrophosphatase PpaX [Paenibacillus]MUG67187.1 pyrophosphatase PpaX [Paenibacillus campinasensis]PAD71956.1 pyrophosphatase PpaX [Paenibacillus campinasensis]PAK48171.1 pyrophosphatase PpaX [Paenibacillus sp. 7541]
MIETVLFDLDGTIIDTNELIISSFIHVFEQRESGPLTREQIIPHMGTTLEHQLQAFSGEEDVSHFVKAYRAFNSVHHDEMVRPFPHVNEVVERLHAHGLRLGVVTTKIRPSTMMTLEKFGLEPYMSAVVTVNDVEHPKPHPEPVLTAVEQLGCDPETTLMIGDSPVDIQSAKAAGVKAAAVAWSLKGVDKLQEYGPDYIINDMRDLYDIIGLHKE